MAVVRYIARRSLLLGTSIGDQVTLDLPAKYAGISPQRQAQVSTRESMSGIRESYYYRGKVSHGIMLIPVSSTVANQLRQFLDSVEDGQVFSYAADASSTTPSPEYLSVVVDPAQYTYAPHPEQQNLTQFSQLTFVEVP